MKPTLLIVLILALFAGNANTQGDGVAKWPTDFEFVLRSGAMSSPRCMARDNGSLRWNQAGVHMWNCNAWAEDQSAAFVNFGSYGYDMMYRIGYRSDVAPLCLDVPGGNFAEGVRIRLWECNYTIAQRFELVLHHYAKREGLARYLLRSMTQPEYCLGVTPNALKNGAPITLQDCRPLAGSHSFNYWYFVGRDGRTYAPYWWERAGLEKLARTQGRLAPTESIGGGAGGISRVLKNETSVATLTRVTGLRISAQNATHVLWWKKMPEEPQL